MYECRIHEGEVWETLPATAVEFGKPKYGGYRLYRLPDNSIHELRSVRPTPPAASGRKTAHTRFHVPKGLKKPDCVFCNPPAEPVAVEVKLLQEVVNVLTELPSQPESEPPTPVPEAAGLESEVEVESTTTMAAAFRKFKS